MMGFKRDLRKLFNEKHMINVVGGIRLSQWFGIKAGIKVQGFIDDEFLILRSPGHQEMKSNLYRF